MIRGYLVGDKETVAKLTELKGSARLKVKQSLVRLTLQLLARVKQDKLSGQVLNVRTGRLRRSINQRIEEKGSRIDGFVGTNVEYAKFHEFGFHGPEQVKDHLRLAKQAFGRPLKFPVWQHVRAHTRQVDYPAKSFLRSALKEMEPKIRAEMDAALQTVFKGNLS